MNQEHYKLAAMVYDASAVGNFDLENFSATEFEEVSTILSMKKKDLKQRGLGNKPNAAQPVETR